VLRWMQLRAKAPRRMRRLVPWVGWLERS